MSQPDYICHCEVSLFHGRDEDDWYLLEWWSTYTGWPKGQWVVYQAPTEAVWSTPEEGR